MSYKAQPFYLLEPLNKIPEIRGTIKDHLSTWLEQHSYSEPKLLYHYTTLEGLKGILENRSIWFSHMSTLNDPLELQYGKKIIIDEIESLLKEEKDPLLIRFFLMIRNFVEAFGKHMMHLYIACFCEDDNLLSQWRSYSSNGGGYNLGLQIDSKTNYSNNPLDYSKQPLIFLRKVIYVERDQKDIIKNYLTKIVRAFNEASLRIKKELGEIPKTWESELALEVLNPLFDIMCCLKQEVFKEETEWRLILINQEDKVDFIKFREMRGSFIPYFNVHIYEDDSNPKFPLKKIKYGPLLENSDTDISLRLYLRHLSKMENKIIIKPEEVEISGAGYNLKYNK